ncbi:Diacylglycerol O-acyltransferase 1 [Papilio machaon]|uniref:O-acyltransferase n=1 Tax=Papilio machaon TaxID=76193 RepID=A0A194RCV3_PAPMA|nr:Diacylglycerol O-acyltransferase 1 [Papilio machaon]
MTTEAEEKALRYRRAQSVTRAEEITEKEKKARRLQVDKPCHKPRDSLFSWSSEFTNFTGLVNWGFLMLTIGGLRLCLENFLKYGILVNPLEWIIVLTGYSEGRTQQYPSIILLIFSVVPVVISLIIERAISVDILSDKIGISLQISNIVFLISLPVVVLHFRSQDFSFVGITTVCMIYLILFLKLWSYCHTNYWCRSSLRAKPKKTKLRRQSLSAPNYNELMNAEHEQSLDDEKSELAAVGLVQYPDNLNLKDLLYFLFAPTLCYELNFPRTTRIRKRFLIKRIVEVVFGVNLVMALFQQWMIPTVTNSVHQFSEMNMIKMAERLLKLAMDGCLFEGISTDNLNLKDLLYFLFAPTLCYELNFPRTTRIRKRFLIKRIVEVVFGVNLVMALFQQWMIPTVTNSVHQFSEMNMIKMAERLLKLAVPNHLIWLCFFYLTFHSFLNLMGELLHFADRNFYNDWWNANNIATFWSSWNRPVHMWALRHVYIPITDRGYGKSNASIVVFFLSAFFHEYLVSVPLQMFRIWAFLGMMAQPPLSIISRFAEVRLGPRWGNIIVWSSLILGQPLAIMMYYHDYALTHTLKTPPVI